MPDTSIALREELNELLCTKCGISEARDFQLTHGCDLVSKKDLFLVVGPGMGETLVICAPLLYAQKHKQSMIALVVVPSKVLAEKQAGILNSCGLRTLAIHEDTLRHAHYQKRDLFKELLAGNDVRVAVVTPRTLQSEQVNEILYNPSTCELFAYVFVLEVHLFNELDKYLWRPPYEELQSLRIRLPSSTVWAAMTGTATIAESRALASGLDFQPGHYVDARYTTDRPHLKYITRFLEHPLSGSDFFDLSFLVPPDMQKPEDIPTTLIFCQTIDLSWQIMTFLDNLIPEGIPNRTRLIKLCNAVFQPDYHARLKTDMEAGRVRIGVCSEDYSYGLDIRSVRVVVTLGAISSFAKMKQQFCHAGRDGGPALVYTFAPAWVRELPSDEIKTEQQRDDAARREKLPKVILDWYNASAPVSGDAPRCPRQVDLEHNDVPFVQPQECCHYHNSSPQLETDRRNIAKHIENRRAAEKKKTLVFPPSDGTYRPLETRHRGYLTDILTRWRLREWQTARPKHTDLPSNVLLPKHLIERLAENAHVCTSYENFEQVMTGWGYLASHGPGLFNLVTEILKGFKDIRQGLQCVEDDQQPAAEPIPPIPSLPVVV